MPDRITLDAIGALHSPPVIDAAGEIVTPGAPLPGWHVNATHPVPGWDAQRTTPATPRREFAGAPTVFYTFASQAAYLAALATANLAAPAPVPDSVTARQAEQALILAGLYDRVEPAIDAIANPKERALVRSEWRRSQTFERTRPALLGLAQALGMSSAQLDDLFRLAKTL